MAKLLPRLLVYSFTLFYVFTLSYLSLARHAAHQTNALDLGYYSNTLWNTLHGQPFRFTTYHDAAFAFPEFDPRAIKQPDNLLAYHVEPILLPLSLLYWFFPDLRAVLILQTLVLASGALPTYAIARRRLAPQPSDRATNQLRDYATLVFPLVYLLSPSLIGANLSDFHPVSFSAALFLWAFDALERRALKTYVTLLIVILSLKEEMGLMVLMWGMWQVADSLWQMPSGEWQVAGDKRRVASSKWRVALLTMALAVVWTVGVVLIQREAAGRNGSLFFARYAWLGQTPRAMATNLFTTTALWDWLMQPDVYGYLVFLLAQVGFSGLLAPEVLLIALPEIAINTLSNFDWMRSGIAHYSAPIVPWLVIAAIVGTKRARDISLPSNLQSLIFSFLILIILASATDQCYRAGQLPFTPAFTPYRVTEHHRRLTTIIAHIPSAAKVSAQSSLYPHISTRANAYLFPTVGDADYILLDVTGQTYPIASFEYASRIQPLLDDTPFGIVAAEDGYLLLARNQRANQTLPDAFFAFARANERLIEQPMGVRFGDNLELLGYDFELLAPRHAPQPAVTVRTYWRALRSITTPQRIVVQFYAPEGYRAYSATNSPTEQWYPTTRWQVGEVIVVEQRDIHMRRGGKIGVSVEQIQSTIIIQPQVSASELLEEGVLKLVEVR
jgi:uncharacterized membrane protein